MPKHYAAKTVCEVAARLSQIRNRHWVKRETEKTIKEIWSAKVR